MTKEEVDFIVALCCARLGFVSGGRGERGRDGRPGEQGLPGMQGARGAPGIAGERGEPGIQGPKGDLSLIHI